MKKLLLLLLGFTSSLFLMAKPSTLNDDDEQNIKLNKEEQADEPTSRPRKVAYLEAFYSPSSHIVNIKHEGLGECDIYLFDASGEIVDQESLYSHYYSVASLSVPTISGIYTIVIDSETVYAYGIVSAN